MKFLLFLILSFLAFSANTQTELWNRKVSKGTYMSQLDNGKIFLKDKNKIYLVDHLSGEREWKINFSSENEPQFLEDLPIMYFEGNSYAVIDATTGFIIDESQEKTEILKISYFWDKGRVIVEMARDKNIHILNLDLNDLSKSWDIEIGPAERSLFGLVSHEVENIPVLTDDGTLVLVDKKYVSIVDDKGNIIKSIYFDKNLKSVGYNKEKHIFYVLEGKRILHFIDITNGVKNASFEFDKSDIILDILGDGSTISVVQINELRILDGVLGMQLGSHGFEHKINQTYFDEETGKLFVLTYKWLSEIDLHTGALIRRATFAKSFNDIYKVYDKVIISGNNGSIPIDLESLKLEYELLPDIPPVHDYVEKDNYTIYTNQRGDDFSLSVVDEIGNVIWDKSFYSVFTPSLDVIGDGLLIINGRKVRYLDISSGKSIWQKSIEVDPAFTYGIDEETNDLFMYSKKRLYRFDYADGSLTKSKDKFKFDDFDYAVQKPQLMVLPDAIFLKGSNTVIVVSKEGKLIHKKTYERISNVSTILKLANLVVTATAIGTGNVGEIVTVYSDDGSIQGGGLVDGLNQNWAFSEDMKYNRQAKQNRSSNAYPYVFTKLRNGKRGLIFINPSTGLERLFVVLDEKDPDYIVDDVDGVLFHLKERSLIAYGLK